MVPDERLSVIALHGLARSDEEIERMAAPVRNHLGSLDIRWVFPRAPHRPVTILGGQPALAWYDILTRDRSLLDEPGSATASSTGASPTPSAGRAVAC